MTPAVPIRSVARLAFLLAVWGAGAAVPCAGAALGFLGVRNSAGDSEAAATAESSIRDVLERQGSVVDTGSMRNELRRLRLRDPDSAPAGTLRELAERLDARWLVSVAIRQAARRPVPSVLLSARVYDGETGEPVRMRLSGASGLDSRSVLGLGVVEDLPVLIERTVDEMFEEIVLVDGGSAGRARASRATPPSETDRIAVVPLSAATPRNATAIGETASEALRAALLDRGADLVSPPCVDEAMRRHRIARRGAVDAETLKVLRDECGATRVLTGEVLRLETGGGQGEPEPRVALALRALDVESGRIQWIDALDRGGWDREGLFRLGRVYSEGELMRRVVDALLSRLERRGRAGLGRS